MILCGMQKIDVDDWQQNTAYKDYTVSSRQIVWFWKVRLSVYLGYCLVSSFLVYYSPGADFVFDHLHHAPNLCPQKRQ